MQMFKRIGFLLLTNLMIVLTISIVLSVLGVRPYLRAGGIDFEQLAVFCLVWGLAGAFISLSISRLSAKWMMGVSVIDPNNPGEFGGLVQMVHQLARQANLPAMPEVGIYQSPEVNAFATGPTKSRSLVAVSTGLLRQMNSNETQGVLAHEIAHIQNGDMVTLTLIQGVVNAFVMFFARTIAYFISQGVKEESRYFVQSLVAWVFEILFGILGMMVVCYFSRTREFRADAGSAKLAGKGNMIAALNSLLRMSGATPATAEPASMQAFKISSGSSKGLRYLLFASHPPLEERIRALEQAAI